MTDTIDTAEDTLPDVALEAERATLGAMLWTRNAVNRARLDLTEASFYRPFHGELFTLITDLEDAGHRCDAQLLFTVMHERRLLGTDGTKTTYIFDLHQQCHTPGNINYHIRAIRSSARVRALQAEHQRMGGALAAAAETGDTETLLDAAAQQAIALELLADQPDSEAPVPDLSTWDTFVTETAGADRWIVPDLIGRMDMIMILASPGAGKSFLSRLVCIALASGKHPFTLEKITPVRTLLIDLENAPGQVADETAPLLAQITRLTHHGVEDRGWVWRKPDGLNIRKRADAQLFERVIAETRPDVVAFGSLGQAYRRGNDGWDVAGDEVHDVLKRIRTRYDLAFWIEHHMGRAQGGTGHTGTPFGGTSWEKWPTHGRVLRKAHDRFPIYLLEAGTFRGDRGPRPGIPIALKRGGTVGLEAIYEEAELELLLEAAS